MSFQQNQIHIMIVNTNTTRKRAEDYLVQLAVRKGKPVGYEALKPLLELKLIPVVMNAADPRLLKRMTKPKTTTGV